ncbi:hypothetical protein [Haladaptatus sp. NG-WS-4]
MKNELSSRIGRWTRLFCSLRRSRWSLSYYDLVLFTLPTVLLAGLVVSETLAISRHVGVLTAGIVSAFVLADAIFNRPPSGRSA